MLNLMVLKLIKMLFISIYNNVNITTIKSIYLDFRITLFNWQKFNMQQTSDNTTIINRGQN